MAFLLESVQLFWLLHPALLYGLSMLLGFACAWGWNHGYLAPLIFLFIPLSISKNWEMRIRCFLALTLSLTAFGFAKSYYRFPELPKEGLTGTAYIEISSVQTMTSFGKKWLYKGTLRSFDTNETTSARNIPIAITFPYTAEIQRPPANRAYSVVGRLKELDGRYTLMVSKETPWHPVEWSWSFAEVRYRAKQVVSEYIHAHISGRREAAFLAGIATGDFDDKLMSLEFSRFGLQHIMAISGFHFAIIAGILSALLRLFFDRKKSAYTLIFLLSSYFVFLGCGPSIMRAWVTILIALFGFVVERGSIGLNSLGVALLVVLFVDPLLCKSIGFQFSFITTAAILIFYSHFDGAMQSIFKKRDLSLVVEMDRWNQHGYCLLAFFRQGLALTAAVNVIALPMTLYYFQKFPLMSLLYNLFFPFLVSIAMLFLLLALLFSAGIPWLGDSIHALNSHYTHFVLNFTYNMPPTFDFVWRVTPFSSEILLFFLTFLFGGGIYLRHFDKECFR